MTDKNLESKPLPAKTIRVGQEMFNDIYDYYVLIRIKNDKGEEEIITRSSSAQWGHGAMAAEIGFIENMNSHFCDEDCGHGGEDD